MAELYLSASVASYISKFDVQPSLLHSRTFEAKTDMVFTSWSVRTLTTIAESHDVSFLENGTCSTVPRSVKMSIL